MGPHSHILVAVSGGADSVALLHMLQAEAGQHQWRLTVAHLHHGIRGAAADEDARFVRTLARRLNCPCVVGRVAVPARAKRRGISLEMAAREARYAFLVRVARRVKADAIATAHTADDQAETILLKLMRGAGRPGLSGIERCIRLEGIPVVRPLLALSRAEIEAYLRARKESWREDASNRDPAFLRNRVRHELLPLLERDYNPRIREALLRAREVFSAEDEWMDQLTQQGLKTLQDEADGSLDGAGLTGLPLAARRRVLLAWLSRRGVPEACLDFESIARLVGLSGPSRGSKTIELAGGWRVRNRYGRLWVQAPLRSRPVKSDVIKPVKLRIPGVTAIPRLGVRVSTVFTPTLVRERGQGPGVWPARCVLSLAALGDRGLYVRCRKPGDRMSPYGMKGSKKIQDILVDAKVPVERRAGLPLLECGGDVVWLPGYRIARNWAVDARAPTMLQVTVESLAE